MVDDNALVRGALCPVAGAGLRQRRRGGPGPPGAGVRGRRRRQPLGPGHTRVDAGRVRAAREAHEDQGGRALVHHPPGVAQAEAEAQPAVHALVLRGAGPPLARPLHCRDVDAV